VWRKIESRGNESPALREKLISFFQRLNGR